MGIAGHVGVAFEPADEALAVAVVTGAQSVENDDWCKHQIEFGLTGDDYFEMHLVLQKLAAHDASLEPLASVILGKRSVGQGPGTDFFLYRADEVQAAADAFGRVTEDALDAAIAEALVAPELNGWDYPDVVRTLLKDPFWVVAREVAKVGENGWGMIGFMC